MFLICQFLLSRDCCFCSLFILLGRLVLLSQMACLSGHWNVGAFWNLAAHLCEPQTLPLGSRASGTIFRLWEDEGDPTREGPEQDQAFNQELPMFPRK